jgi:hypothetical protein
MKRGSGGITHAGFDIMTSGMKSDPVILISSSDAKIKPSETLADRYYKDAIAVPTKYDTKQSAPGMNIFLGRISIKDLNTSKKIVRFGLKSNDKLYTVDKLKTRLTCSNIDRLEVQIGLKLLNQQQVKYFFKS